MSEAVWNLVFMGLFGFILGFLLGYTQRELKEIRTLTHKIANLMNALVDCQINMGKKLDK